MDAGTEISITIFMLVYIVYITNHNSRNRLKVVNLQFVLSIVGQSDFIGPPFLGLAFLAQASLPQFSGVVGLLQELAMVAEKPLEVVRIVPPTKARLSTKIAQCPSLMVVQKPAIRPET